MHSYIKKKKNPLEVAADATSFTLRSFRHVATIYGCMSHLNLYAFYFKQILGYLVESDRLGILMEWCHLGSLHQLLQKNYSGLLSEPVARKYVELSLQLDFINNFLGY